MCKALASWIFLSFTSFWRNSDSYEYKNKSAKRGAQFVPIGMPTTCWNSIPPNSRFAEFLPLIYPPEWKLKIPLIPLLPHHFWTYTSNLMTVVKSVLKFMNKYFWNFCWFPYLYTFSLYENPSFIICSAETEYISTRSWYRNDVWRFKIWFNPPFL
jgi:hypothetical protein